MKKLFLLAALSAFCLTASMAQQPDRGFYMSWESSVSTHGKSFQAIESRLSFNYLFRGGLFAGIDVNAPVGLFDNNGIRNYESPFLMGVTGGYEFYKAPHDGFILDVRASAGWSFNNSDWRTNCYGVGVYCNYASKMEMRPFVGLGCRYFDTRNSLFSNYMCFYIALGFTL